MAKCGDSIKSAFSLEGKNYTMIIWACVLAFMMMVICSAFFSGRLASDLLSIADVLVFLVAVLHGLKRFRWKKMSVFFLVTWLVSNAFESLSIKTGFPFGYYTYTSVIPGPSILGVPVLIMPTYFGMGYMSYTVSCILNNQFGDAVKGIKVFTVPLIGTFIMVMWDLVMDPVATNIQNAWVWKEPGLYFNVPLSNYFGWCLVVYLFLQIFSIINAKTPVSLANGKFSKLFWLPASTVIGMQGVSHVIQGFFLHPSNAILLSTSLISIFTLCFVALISALSIFEKKNEAVLSLTAKG